MIQISALSGKVKVSIIKNNKLGADFGDGPLIYLVNGGEDIGINIEQHGFAFIAAC